MILSLSHKRSPSHSLLHRTSRSSICIYSAVAISLFLAAFVWSPLPERIDHHRDAIVQHVSDAAVDHLPASLSHSTQSLATVKSKYAFATFLGGQDEDSSADINDDSYFVAARILAYQLLHAPETRSRTDIPFIVLVTPKVTEAKRKRLRKDGAIVYEAVPVVGENIHPAITRWADVMSKLRLWELTQFERIAFLDADTILNRPIDGVFEDPAVSVQETGTRANLKSDEGALPGTFGFAGTPEMKHKHKYPPTQEDWPNESYFNAGFFVMAPSLETLAYYLSIMILPDRYDSSMPEQNLLNYAHRRQGNMPWKQLQTHWNVHYPSIDDLNGGVASLHEKWWIDVPGLASYMQSWRWKMETFYQW